MNSAISNLKKQKQNVKWAVAGEKNLNSGFVIIFLEKEKLLSKISGDSIVGSLRDEKESCSTQSGLRVDTGFEEF